MGASHSLVVLVADTRVSGTDIANVLKLAVFSGAACRGNLRSMRNRWGGD